MFTYAFIFYRGITQSNLPYKELLSLIRKHSETRLWHVTACDSFTNLLNKQEKRTDCSLIEPDDSHIKIQCFHNSMLVHTSSRLDLEKMIASSGYIQSCGELVFESPWYDIDAEKITDKLSNYQNKQPRKFIFYTMEDYGLDTPSNEGVDGVKFFRNKHFIGNDLARNFIGSFQQKLKGSNDIVKRYPFDTKANEQLCYHSIFIIKDSVISGKREFEIGHITDQQHLIAYHSQYKKENPIHIMDDWRPFWPGQYTTPAVLATAALNLLHADKQALVIDPFSGSGGIGLAASSLGLHCVLSDLCGSFGIEYNFRFFRDSLFRNKLLTRLQTVTHQLTLIDTSIQFYLTELTEHIKQAIGSEEMHWNCELDSIVNNLNDYEKIDVFLIYKILYFNKPFLQDAIDWHALSTKYIAEVEKFIRKSQRAFLVERAEAHPDNNRVKKGQYGALVSRSDLPWGDFHVTGVSADLIDQDIAVLELSENASQIIMATDLPYGVNTQIGENDILNKLYADSFRAMFNLAKLSKKKKVSFILFSLQAVKIGKRVPESAFSKNVRLVLHQVANEFACVAVKSPNIDDIPAYLNSAGYWRSEKALDREVLFHEFMLLPE